MVKPKKLEKGDTIGIVSLASPPFGISDIMFAKKQLENMGFNVILSEYISEQYKYLAGEDDKRLQEFYRFLEDKSIKAIMSTRGGYGTGRFLRKLDFEKIKANPKIIIGYSDITSLLLAIYKKTGLVTFYGPMFTSEFASSDISYTKDKFIDTLVNLKYPIEISGCNSDKVYIFRDGYAEGELVGGCLSLIVSTLGTPYEIDTDGKILFFEDVGEAPYRIDAMLTHLINAGKFDKLAGLVIGEMIDCTPNRGFPMGSFHWEEVILDRIKDFSFPVISGICFGHGKQKATIPIGTKARIDTELKKLILLEVPVL